MSESAARVRRQNPAFWIGCLVVVSFAAGIWTSFTPSIGSFVKPSVAVLLIIAGVVLLSPFAMSRPINEQQRKVRKRVWVMGGVNVIAGVAQLLPSVWSIALMSAVLVMAAAAMTWSKLASRATLR